MYNSSFAKNGVTVPQLDKGERQPTNSEKLTFLNISSGDDYKMQTVQEFGRGSFWNQLGIF